MPPIEQKMFEWRDAEKAAIDAEVAVDVAGGTVDEAQIRELVARATALRREADRRFAALIDALPAGRP